MIELLLVILAGIGVGILTGLLPALPVFTGPFLLYYFYGDLPLEHMIVFWLCVVSGTQFFGSVATITTRIPGEESSAIYLDDLNGMKSWQLRVLLYKTAVGSFIAGLIAVMVLWFSTTYLNPELLPKLMSIDVQIIIYTLAILSFFFISKKFWWTLGLIALGIMIGPRNNYALNDTWYQVQYMFQGYTFYMVLLGTILIPEVLRRKDEAIDIAVDYSRVLNSGAIQKMAMIKNSIIGSIAGLIPGPSATLGSVYAYKLAGKDKSHRIVSAETANNASVITSAIPFLLLAMPININTMIMSNLMDIQSIDIQYAILEPSTIFPSLNVIQVTMIALVICLMVYRVLSTHLINWYVAFIDELHNKTKYILIAIVSALIAVDLYTSEITVEHYLLLLAFFTAIGFVLKKYKVNPIVLLFSIILSDKLIWLYIQSYNINFT